MEFDFQETTPLLESLQKCARSSNAPFYTPGHKRGQGFPDQLTDLLGTQVGRSDLPELPELDNLFAPQGAILAAQQLAARAFGADETWFLVNGSTCGMIASILATCRPGDKIILPRNGHQSAIAGLILSGAIPIFVNPEYDPVLEIAHSITPDGVAQALATHPDAKAVMMLYPTYYGVCGDVEAIAQIAHQYDIPLIVDEAHGSHFAFHPDLPIAALAAGADLTVQSIHKTLASMTQSAMLHLRGQRIERDRIQKALQLIQSTSPSYLLLASLDAARQQMATQGLERLEHTLNLADNARSRLEKIPVSTLQPSQAGKTPGFLALDRTRLTVTVSELGWDGFAADDRLNQHLKVTAEFPSLKHLTFIISLGNTQQDIDQLIQAFTQLARHPNPHPSREAYQRQPPIPRKAEQSSPSSLLPPPSSLPPPPLLYSPRDAFFAATETLAIAQTVDHISAELICPYPPGIPALFPGEKITQDVLIYLQQVLLAGGMISGCADLTLQTLQVVKL
ncbi:aminotransferase class I/II-fold pyridoxal phosphate-dependent enzyme [Phormidesmis sp. 146-33]